VSVTWVFRPALDRMRAAFPTAYWRGRNAIALAGMYAYRLAQPIRSDADAYDDEFWNFHGRGDWTGFARVVLSHVPARTIVDVGCGQGLTLAGFAQIDSSLSLRGFDDSPAALRRARARGLAVDALDILALRAPDAAAVAARLSDVDLAICLEVAEHLPAWHAGKLLTILSAAKRLVFSAAHPNQGGRFHVNEQPAEYWIERLAAHGFSVAPYDDQLRREIAALDLPWWYARNVHAFERRRHAT
jgi:SAM-dependent methyltransferase